MPELDDVLRDAKASLERLAGAEKEAQDLRVQRDALAREVAGLTKELESRKKMEREHDAKYAESLHAATLLGDLKKSREDNVKALNVHVAIEAAAQERMEELKREHARAIDASAALTTAARAEHESSRKAADAEHQASLAELRTQHGRLVAAHKLELAEKDREMLAATNQLRHDAAQRMQKITAENDTKHGELQRAHELEVRRVRHEMEEIIMTTKSAPTASVEAFMANEASSNELASKLELAYMEIQTLQQVLAEKQGLEEQLQKQSQRILEMEQGHYESQHRLATSTSLAVRRRPAAALGNNLLAPLQPSRPAPATRPSPSTRPLAESLKPNSAPKVHFEIDDDDDDFAAQCASAGSKKPRKRVTLPQFPGQK